MKEMVKKTNLTEMRNEFLEYIDVSKKTLDTYTISLRQFFRYMQENDISEPTRTDIINFREQLISDGHSVSTINTYLVAIRNFFKFLSYKEVYKNISENIKSLKDTELHKRESLSLEQCQALLNSAKNLRETIIVKLGLVCGLRINAIANIRLCDFKFEEQQYRLYILNKGRKAKTDYVIVPNGFISELKEYIKEYNITDFLFISKSKYNNGTPLKHSAIRKIVNSMFERADLKKDTIVFHSLRHTFATLSLESGMDIREVSQAMLHSSIVVTERYLHDLDMRNNKCSNNVFDKLQKGGIQ